MSNNALAPKSIGYAWSPRRCLRIETSLCPKVPNDFEQARVEAIMEEYGWPIEDDDTHPDQGKADKEQEELNVLYYEDWLYPFEWDDYPGDLLYDDVEARPGRLWIGRR
jgi:beta-galactosidase/beta-glucuronidase